MPITPRQAVLRFPSVIDLAAKTALAPRLTHVENATLHLYDLVEERTRALQAALDERTTSIYAILADHTGTLDDHSRKLDNHTQILAGLGRKLDEILRRLPEPS
jgi:hypothetical protein